MKKVQGISLHHHLEEESIQLPRTIRIQILRGLPQTRHPLFVIIARGKDTTLSIVCIYRLYHFARGKFILRNIDGQEILMPHT
jgi:hypothetical protein